MSHSPDLVSELIERLQQMVREKLAEEERELATRFLAHFYARVPEEILTERDPLDLYGAALAQWRFAQRRRPEECLLRVYNPELEAHGWECPHTVVEIVTEDMPFLVDSVRMEIARQGLQVLQVFHPTFHLRRNERGEVVELFQGGGAGKGEREAVMHLELIRQSGRQALEALRAGLQRVLADVRRAVTDWGAMRQALERVRAELEAVPPPVDPVQREETAEFLHWLEDHHFTFLGYRRYELVGEPGEESLRIVPGSGLGILREVGGEEESQAFAGLPPELRAEARVPRLLVLTKTNARATVHRPVNLDYVGVKCFGAAGEVTGEHRFLGLYGSRAYSGTPCEIPVLRRKMLEVQERAGLEPEGHSAKALQHILDTYPRDELFQIDSEDLYRIAMGILALGERQRPRLFLRPDPYGRFMVCLVYCSRERYDTRVRQRMQGILREAFDAREVEFSVSLTSAPMARIMFTVRTHPGEIPGYDVHDVEARLAEAVLAWQDRLRTTLLEHLGEERGNALYQAYANAFPAAYQDDFPARSAVRDIEQMTRLGPDNELGMSLYRPLEASAGHLRFKVFRLAKPVPLSQALPMLEHMGVRVEDERPYRIERPAAPEVWVHDFGLSHAGQEAPDTGNVRTLFQDAFAHIWRGRLVSDRFNALVLRAHLNWRQVSLLRACAKYLRQTAVTFSQAYMEEAMGANPGIARLLVELFEARFDPDRPKQAQQRIARLSARIDEALDAVESLDHDRILRSFLAVIQATLRTNYFQRGPHGGFKPRLALKLDSRRIPELPEPRPLVEIFVYSPRVEGVHLRGGRVARGGLRWSDRKEDYRTEVLGLMKAQMVKNAVIVPVGAKGGFVVKQFPDPTDRTAVRAELEYCYRQFVGALLDLTDNLVGGHGVPPADLVRYDDDDPYLVVAADKGTATFSDLANEVAAGYGFWLGDAFASGGRTGYDHKKMGITARSAWECVRQHFHALGIDYVNQAFTVAGIGDMSGDVFGNGLLWSRRIRLLAAFDHRHIFIDPDPDPEASFRERERLFGLASSSWADYDAHLISLGGGVYPRSLKSIRLSPRAQEVLGTRSETLTPADLIRTILCAPVDLLWNGGIGTYVKASWERNADVGDRANDTLRVDARNLRCRVLGEGGNLGLTQPARIEFARHGGRLDSDFIHNAGGVNCSDHEVNIKILLDRVVGDGDMTRKQRDQLLQEMTEEVARLVLQDSYWQACAISLDEARAADLLPEQVRFMRHLEQEGHLNRALEFLPDDEELAERQGAGRGLTRPELALLVSYAKHTLFQQLLATDLPEDPCMALELERYFPTPLRTGLRERIHGHRLRREILAASVANRMVNRFGSTFAFRLQEELGVSAAALARAYAAVWEVFGLRRLWSAAAAMDLGVPQARRLELLAEAGRLARRGCRWLLQRQPVNMSVADLIARYREEAQALAAGLPDLLEDKRRQVLEERAEPLIQAGVDPALALWVAGMDSLSRALDLAEVADAAGVAVEEAARVYFALGADLELDWLEALLTALPSQDRWHASARASLRDDLHAQHRDLCAAVLTGAMQATSARSRLESWRHQHHAAVERYRKLFYDLQSQDKIDMAMLSVALREVQRLALATRPVS
jgi:glutamate dehydrogenase